MAFDTPGFCSWKNYDQSELSMPDEHVQSKIKYYKMSKKIYATGGSGEIHIGVDPKTDMEVAIKRGFSKKRSTYGVSRIVLREIRVLKELNTHNHPNIVHLLDVFPHDGDLFIVEDFYPSYIQQYYTMDGFPFNEQQIKYIIHSTVKGLIYLKEMHVIHCDIKPDNLLISDRSTVSIGDFGSSRVCRDGVVYHTDESCISTTYYNPPEVLLGLSPITYAVDVWSCAVSWLKLLNICICDSEEETKQVSPNQMCQSLFSFLGVFPTRENWLEGAEKCRLSTLHPVENKALDVVLRKAIPVSKCSDEGISLLCAMLALNPSKRITVEEIDKHPYFRDSIYDSVLRGEMNGPVFPKKGSYRKCTSVPPLLTDFFTQQRVFELEKSIVSDSLSDEEIRMKRLSFDTDGPSSPINDDSFRLSSFVTVVNNSMIIDR